MSKVTEKMPQWVERLLIPTMESRVREIVKEEVGHLEKIMDTRFEAVNSKIDSLDKRLTAEIQELRRRLTGEIASLRSELQYAPKVAVLEAKVNELEKRTATH
jgi:predicted RNase H-like nuclease (RuvC/YqgF family)